MSLLSQNQIVSNKESAITSVALLESDCDVCPWLQLLVSTMSMFFYDIRNYFNLCIYPFFPYSSTNRSFQNLATSRQFSTSHIALARQRRNKINIPSKKALAAKAKRKAGKAPKHIYHKEQMPLTDAVTILRVRLNFSLFMCVSFCSPTSHRPWKLQSLMQRTKW
jgi:hypothetical protein